MRHFGRNLIVHSDERAIMINSAGHVIFETPLDGSGSVVAEIFKDKNGEIISCFVKGEKVTIYKEYSLRGVFAVKSEALIRGDMTEVFEPSYLFFDQDKNELFLVVKEGVAKERTLVITYQIDHVSLSSKKVAQ